MGPSLNQTRSELNSHYSDRLLADQRCRKSSNDLDKVGLAAGSGFYKQAPEVRLDRAFGNTEGHRNLRYTADFDDRHQHAQLGRGQIIGAGDAFWSSMDLSCNDT